MLRNKRLELGLLKQDVAKRLGVCTDSITLWETEKAQASVKHYPNIIAFLGYFPFQLEGSLIAIKIKRFRYDNGLTQEELAQKLSINESTVYHYEKDIHKPLPKILYRIECLIGKTNKGETNMPTEP